MNGSRQSANSRGERASLDALNRTIEGLEARIAGLMQGATRDQKQPERSTAGSAEPRRPERSDSPLLQEIRDRQRVLEATREAGRADASTRKSAESSGIQPPRRDIRQPEPRNDRASAPLAERRPLSTPLSSRHSDAGSPDLSKSLASLKQELRQDISDGLTREMTALRAEIRSAGALAADPHFTGDLRDELRRMADCIDNLTRRSTPAQGDLRAELDDLRRMVDGVAREESIARIETRWEDMESRLQEFDSAGIRQELIALAYRIDGIKAELGTISDNPSIRALEDRLLSLAQIVEDLGDRPIPADLFGEQFSQIDGRLDEISCAIASSARSRGDASEHLLARRLDERLDALTDQIDAMSRASATQSAAELALRIEALTDKVDLLSETHQFGRFEERLDDLTSLLHGGSSFQPQAELAGYLSDISRKIDALDANSINDVLADRLDYLTRRIDEIDAVDSRHAEDAQFDRLTSRLDGIAARLDEAARSPVADSRSLQNLEQQIAHLSSLLSESSPVSNALPPALDERMSAIESYMATSDEYILEAARHAAEAVVDAYGRGGREPHPATDMSAIVGLAEDLRHLEDLTRHSEEKTQQTFSALHRTLVQIAERLDSMEGSIAGRSNAAVSAHAPEPRREPVRPPMAAEPAAQQDSEEPRGVLAKATEELLAETASQIALQDAQVRPSAPDQAPQRKSLLSGLTKRLMPATRADQPVTARRETVDPTPALDPADVLSDGHENDLLEPGSGMPDVRKILERVRASQTGNDGGQRNTENERIDYIAAARRAAKAAALETDPNQPNAGKSAKITKSREPVASTSAFARHRRPILMAVGAILLALMAMPLVNTLTRGDKAPPPPPAAVTAPATPGPTSQVDTPRAPQQSAKLEKGSDRSADTAAKPVAAAPAPAVSPAPLAPTSAVQATAEDANGEDGDSIPAATAAASPSATTPAATSAPATGIAVPATITPKALADAAASGDPQALFEIGARYTDGRGVTVDMKEAARWYQLSADRGLAPAQYRLGSLYEKGNGVDRDVKKAIGLYTQAANAGNASAMHNLAVLYASGAEGAPNYKAAVEWFTKASNLGVTDSQFNLAILHARGNGTPQNLDESYKWFAIAAKGGDKDAAQKRDEVAKAMKPDQLANARTKVDTWKPMPIDAKANAVTLPDAWGKNQASSSTIDMGKAIRNIQAILNHKGYDAGQPDGMMGKKTVLAIKAFQRKNGLSDDGNITEELVRKLLEQNATKGA